MKISPVILALILGIGVCICLGMCLLFRDQVQQDGIRTSGTDVTRNITGHGAPAVTPAGDRLAGMTPVQTGGTTPVTVYPAPTPRPVAFTLESGAPAGCGLTCRETTATITNTGDETAHSVCVVLEVFNDAGERIFINGGPSVERCIGDLPGGSLRTETIQINADCGFLATRCIGHTLILKTRVRSLEKIQEFPDIVMQVS
ncbi:MAG: hypothetical protein QHH04_00475 [Methanolinea sp.]|jgi:hypothetical protein|nr:hypothetical protein [Methanolinea sp.]